jgi:Family of unknown function (DUF6518)
VVVKRHRLVRTVLVLVAICAFATVDAIVKGHHGGTRNAIGNASAPWVLIPFLAGFFLRPRSLRFGALVGAVSTITALATYSIVRVVSGFNPGGRSQGDGAALITSLGNRWFLLGVIGGAALGALGSSLAVRRQWAAVAGVIASVLVMEPVARVIWAIVKGEAARTLVPSPVVWTAEVVCGCAVWAGFWLRSARHRSA